MIHENEPPTTEIANILFMDLVAFSRLPMEEQPRFATELREIVRSTASFQRASSTKELIPLDLGDGMALVFFRDPLAAVQCAVDISRALSNYPNLRLRMGLHIGPVNRVPDINGNENVSGSGINIAQRVMDCGDAGHILLSHSFAEVVGQFESWAPHLHDIGEAEVKHGVRLKLSNLYFEDVGNRDTPSCLHALPPSAVPTNSRQVALLYRRRSEPDETVLHYLEAALSAAGYSVFVDRHLAVGVEWATEIERQVRSSYAVIPLLSETSVRSEMLDYEIQIASDAAQRQGGSPRILPVRIRYEGKLPDTLAPLLDPIQYTVWESEADNQRLVDELLAALGAVAPESPQKRVKLEAAGGAVPLDSAFYIVRPTDEQFLEAISRNDSIVLVKGARQMGKTSLLARGMQMARQQGARVVLTDFQTLNAAHLESADTLFLTLAELLADQLDLDMEPEEVWNERRGASMNMERFIRKEVLGRIQEPVIWGLDEVDRLFSCSYASEVFGLFRSWHNRRSLDPSGPWSRLTLAIAYATEAHLFITDVNQSPFNVGTRLSLDDLTIDQVQELNRRYGEPLRSAADLQRLYRLLSGHPYLVRRGLDEMVANGISLSAFEAQADRDEGLFGDHLRRILITLSQDPLLTDTIRGVLQGQACPSMEVFYRLRSAGIMVGDSAQEGRLRCQLYKTYLARHLLEG